MYYCKNTGCLTKNALGDRYDDFVKHEKMLIFSKKYMLRISPLDPTERYKHVQTMVQVVHYQKNTGSTTKDGLGDWYDDSLNDVKNANFRKTNTSRMSSLYPIERQKRANDAAADELPQKHGLHNQKCSGEPVRWFWRTGTMILKNTKNLDFFEQYASHQSPRPYRTLQTRSDDGTSCLLPNNTGSTTTDALVDWYDDSLNDVRNANSRKKHTSHMSSLYPTERQKHVQTMLELMYCCKSPGCITKNALGDRYDDFEKHEKMLIFFRKKLASHQSPRPYKTLQIRANDDTSCLLPKKTRVPRR